MELTRKQLEGLRIAVERYRHKEKYTVIGGYAGVGKTTLVKFIISALDLDPEVDVAYVSFTGKASEVLRKKGNPNAQTAHKLLYKTKQLSNGKYLYTPVKEIKYKVVVVDEISMLPKDMWDLLLSYDVYVIACGDPGQLPPVSKDQDNSILNHPHIFLDEVMRQAQESDIIRLSMDVRAGKRLTPCRGHDANVVRKKDLVDGMYSWANQILCATNRTRANINNFMRAAQGRDTEPEIEDKVICLSNSWDTKSTIQQDPLVNGTIGDITDMELMTIPYRIHLDYVEAPVLITSLKTDSDFYSNVFIDYTALTTGKKFFTDKQEYAIRHNKENNYPLPIEFNYGYAITTHRAQGSEWGKVLVLEEWFPNDKEEHQRWVYTAITRASSRLTLVLKD